jgi:hypothetical protein
MAQPTQIGSKDPRCRTKRFQKTQDGGEFFSASVAKSILDEARV